ncbi:terpenoid synthase [Dacryopinax primogenitus]|uniref:Terpene synthase n=1 Tax=Dacryopinax primogenitus (strain DJM 731) TaxID=1858805 RepID=M5FQI3_DACPD|nr:terpenoid synthase [Dacryopinax primogenitus]EJT99155.1 terpenoid synthase [Dacryopinax primogenitus]
MAIQPRMLPSSSHPQAQRIRTGINDWLAEYWPFPSGIPVEKILAKHDLGGLAVWCVPTGDADRLIWAGRLCGLILLADDYIDNDKDLSRIPFMKTAIEGLEPAAAAAPDPATASLNITWRAVRMLSSRQEFIWNVKLTKAWFDTHYEPPTTTLEDYLMARRANIGVHMFLNWVRWALDFDFDDSILTHPLFCNAEDMVADHSGLTNDYYSYEKEKDFESDGMNVVRVLMDRENLDVAAARQRVHMLLLEKEQQFWLAAEAVMTDPVLGQNTKVCTYMINLAHVMGGNISWSEENGRYNLTGVLGYESLRNHVDEMPTACFVPLPI